MSKHDARRRFLQALGIGGLTASLAGMAEETQANTQKKLYSGTSKKGDIVEALHEAIARAESSVRHPDAMVEWSLKSVSGRSGGIAGFRDVTVTIEGKVS